MARFDLKEVQKLIESYIAGEDTLWFSAKSRSVSYVVDVLFCTDNEAEDVVLRGILQLNPSDFARTVTLKWGGVADEYGLEGYYGHNWYVKFAVDNEDGVRVLNEISFHPIEQALKLTDGKVLPVTYSSR